MNIQVALEQTRFTHRKGAVNCDRFIIPPALIGRFCRHCMVFYSSLPISASSSGNGKTYFAYPSVDL